MFSRTFGLQPCANRERRRELGINKDQYVVAILRDRTTVGHVPRKMAPCTLFLQREGSIHCVVTGKHCFHLPHKYKLPKTVATTQRPHLLIPLFIIVLADFNLAVGWSIRQAAKFNSPPNFPAIRYHVYNPPLTETNT